MHHTSFLSSVWFRYCIRLHRTISLQHWKIFVKLLKIKILNCSNPHHNPTNQPPINTVRLRFTKNSWLCKRLQLPLHQQQSRPGRDMVHPENRINLAISNTNNRHIIQHRPDIVRWEIIHLVEKVIMVRTVQKILRRKIAAILWPLVWVSK